jgi:hypothetical protein
VILERKLQSIISFTLFFHDTKIGDTLYKLFYQLKESQNMNPVKTPCPTLKLFTRPRKRSRDQGGGGVSVFSFPFLSRERGIARESEREGERARKSARKKFCGKLANQEIIVETEIARSISPESAHLTHLTHHTFLLIALRLSLPTSRRG